MPSIDPAFSAAISDRYAIERELGRGGMATVYLAHDLRHDRPVALKLLHLELASSLGPERFQREIKLAARLQHPHILSVHDSGEAAGRLWFTMPYVEGESLRSRLTREGPLPVEEALRIAREAADALDYAHRHGVVHRDIKPENLLIADGHALLADFGISRALGATGERLTETGLIIGTPAYMSPEQATGEALNGRTDIYSLGVVLYEMLAGEPPFTGPTAQAIIAKRMTGEVPSPRRTRPAIPASVDQAVLKALAPLPADRFGSAADFARALSAPAASPELATVPVSSAGASGSRRRLPVSAAGLVLGFLLGLGVLFAWLKTNSSETSTGPKRLAVLPFESLGSPEKEYFADGITDAVRGKLTTVPGLQVIARSSSSQYKQTSRSPKEIGRELDVEYLLTGTVRWDKGEDGRSRVQVSPELINVTDATAKWQQPFDAALTDVFLVQADIAGRVAEALGVALGAGDRQALAERPTANLAAYDAYLRGEETSGGLSTSGQVALQRAAIYYGKAVALDSTFALAWAQLSRANSLIYFRGTGSRSAADKALQAAERALALAPGGPETYLAMGDYHANISRKYAEALQQYAQGRRLTPSNAELLTATALVEQRLGRWDAALDHLDQARRLDPRSLFTARRYAFNLLWLRRYPEARAAYDRVVALDPNNLAAFQQRAILYLVEADLPRARAVLRAAPPEVEREALVAYVATYWDLVWLLDEQDRSLLLRLTPTPFADDRGAWGLALAQAHALRNDRRLAQAYADSARMAFESREGGGEEERMYRAVALAYLGRTAEAVREGEQSLAERPISQDAYTGAYYQHMLVRIYLLAGEPEKALDQLEQLLEIPYLLSPGWLRVDPTFDPLRKHQRFQRLVSEGR
ncbi:MAG TPA: protein kinase [Gemmatimonadales bacterium]|nr:protein kinase [Gemmatimonadales bacterium]